jgi:hypothetical protein
MKSIFRLGFMLVMVAMLVVAALPATTARAQSDMCFGLKADDCSLANTTADSAALSKLSSFVMDYTITLKADTGDTAKNIDFKLTGKGPFSIDTTKMSGGAGDPTAAAGALTMANVIQGSLTSEGKTQQGNFELRIVNGDLYFMGDTATQGKWKKVNIAKAISQIAQNPMLGGMMSGMSGAGGLGGASSNPAMAALSDPELIKALAAIPNIPGVITAERKDDIMIGSEKVAVFTYNLNILTLIQSKEFAPVLKAILKSQSGGAEVDDKQVNQMIVMAQTFLKDFKFSITRYVGTADKLPHGIGLHLSLNLDAATASLVMNSSEAKPVSIDFNFDIKLDKIGEQVTVEPVSDAEEVDTGSMMGGSSSSQ